MMDKIKYPIISKNIYENRNIYINVYLIINSDFGLHYVLKRNKKKKQNTLTMNKF